MIKKNITLSFSLFDRILFDHNQQIKINGNAVFLFIDIFIKKSGQYDIVLDKNVKAEKLIISIIVDEYVNTNLFFEYTKNYCNHIEIKLYGQENSMLNLNFFMHDVRQVKKIISAYPSAENANIAIFGSYFATNHEIIKLDTYQFHQTKNGSSNVTLHGIATGNSNVQHNGYIEIAKNAINTKAHQTSKHITLHKNAKVYAKPVLNVLNNNVQCSHGSVIGQISDEQLFYFFSRGISKKEAMKLLLENFINYNSKDNYYLNHHISKLI